MPDRTTLRRWRGRPNGNGRCTGGGGGLQGRSLTLIQIGGVVGGRVNAVRAGCSGRMGSAMGHGRKAVERAAVFYHFTHRKK
jgi:hypothetical protein